MARRPDTVVEVSVIVLFYCDLISSELIDCMEVVTLFFLPFGQQGGGDLWKAC